MTTEQTANRRNLSGLVAAALALWLALVFFLGATGAFVRPPSAPPLPILFGAIVPVLLFLAAYRASSAFRASVLGADLRLLTAIQGWRAGGLGFLSLYANGVLPGLFALPAGMGDIAIGITAPWILLSLLRQPDFASSRRFVRWNLLGILDLVVAVSTGALSSGILPGLAGSVTTAPMARLPLVLIPAYLVPLFVILHLTALFQAQQLARRVEPARHRDGLLGAAQSG